MMASSASQLPRSLNQNDDVTLPSTYQDLCLLEAHGFRKITEEIQPLLLGTDLVGDIDMTV